MNQDIGEQMAARGLRCSGQDSGLRVSILLHGPVLGGGGRKGGFSLVFVSLLSSEYVFPYFFLSASGRVYSYPPRSIARTYIHFSFRRIEVRVELLSAEIVCLA